MIEDGCFGSDLASYNFLNWTNKHGNIEYNRGEYFQKSPTRKRVYDILRQAL